MIRNFKLNKILIAILGVCSFMNITLAQNWSNTDYKKALWMTTRFYGAQRSGDNNWTIAGHLPTGLNAALTGKAFRSDYNTANGVDLSGGWHDCGDHVKFGQTQFYSAYVLLKGYAEFPTGYDDKYSQTYAGYITANNYTWEGSGHDPDCIPDVLNEMKHATDFFIKCTPNSTTFYYQVGNGGCPGDHCRWETAVKMQSNDVNNGGNNDNGTPGTRRPSCSNPNDGSMASFAGATLALMARVYAPYDAAYAALCQTHALNAYNYARTRLTQTAGSCFGGFYGANRDSRDAFVCCCAELFYLTGNTAYRTEAFGHEAAVNFNAGWSFDYANNGELGLYCLAQMGNTNAITRFNNRITGHYLAAGSRNGNGVYTAYGTWGRLRYNGNAAFLIALYSKLNNNTTAAVLNAIYNDVDYIMGRNGSKRSYIVGFNPSAGGPFITPQYPHHRNVYLRDDNPGNAVVLTIPTKNQQLGALVGGQRDGTYNDDRNDYVNSEVCIDYNAGLVGALGFINSRLAPVTITCGGQACRQPNLGPNLSTCSTLLPILLNANAGAPGGVISYRWYTWNGSTKTLISGATGQTYSATAVGSYIVERDSAFTGGPCTKRDTITISNTIATPNLGSDVNLCSPASVNLTLSNASAMPSGTTYQWKSSSTLAGTYTNISGATTVTLANVRTAAYYKLVATSGSCISEDIVQVTSSLPTPVDGCAASGSIALAITNAGTGPYQWYNVPTGGTALATGTTYNAPAAGTYYVQDMSAASGSVGPTTYLGGGTQWGWSSTNQLNFTLSSNVTITSLQVPFEIYGTTAGTIQVEILDNSGNSLSPQRIFTSNSMTPSCASCGVNLLTFTFTGFTIQSSWGTNLRMRIVQPASNPINGSPYWNSSGVSYPYNSNPAGVFTITGSSTGSSNYMYFYNIQFQTGTPCDRLPVLATNTGCTLPVSWLSVSARRIDNIVRLEWLTATETNNDYFIVQRSANGIDFENLLIVDGNGNSSAIQRYIATDNTPSLTAAYYRIVQVDFDGTSDYSSIMSVDAVSDVQLIVKPNPFNNNTAAIFVSQNEQKVDMTLTSVSGEVVGKWLDVTPNMEVSIGDNLAVGVYFLTSWDGTHYKTVKVIKQ